MKHLLLFSLLLSGACVARQLQPLEMPQNPRVMGMAGAFVAVADDPEAGFLNPSSLRLLKQVSYDLFYGSTTRTGPDELGVAFVNPGTDRGTALAMGLWTQGWTEHRQPVYSVPYAGTSFDLTSSTHFGLVLRFPYVSSTDSLAHSGWRTIGDFSALQTLESFRLGATMERAFGGSSNLIPRRLRLGAAFLSASSGVILAYEWQGDETRKSLKFMRSSSRYGAEIPVGEYAALRGGYIAGAPPHITVGVALGTMAAGWRVEGGWVLPAATHGATRWVLGMGYRI